MNATQANKRAIEIAIAAGCEWEYCSFDDMVTTTVGVRGRFGVPECWRKALPPSLRDSTKAVKNCRGGETTIYLGPRFAMSEPELDKFDVEVAALIRNPRRE